MPSAVAATVTFLKTVGLAVGGLSISAGTALAIGAATVVAGAIAAQKLISSLYSVPNLDSDRSRQATVRGTVEPQKLIYGEALVSGPISFVGVSGTDNRDLYHSIVLAGHPSDSISDIYFDDERIQSAHINSAGNVTTGVFGPKDGTTICVVRKLTGSQTTADSVLDGAFNTINSSEHIGTNLTYIVTKFTLTEESQETWDKFLPNDIKALVKGKKVYDPRQDNTSTHYDASVGVSTQRATNSATWAWSDNPVWCLVDYLTDDRFGMDINLDRIDLSKAVDAADICDATVSVPGGTESRYTCNGVIFGTTTHKTNINKILSAMNGMLTYTNGKYVIRAGAFESVGTGMNLTEDNMIGPVKLKTSFERNERFNTITGTFIDPSKSFKEIEFPKVQITSALTRDNNEELTRELKLSMTNSRYMAQRISHKLIQLSDLQKVLTFPTNLAGVNISVGDRVNVTLSEFGYTNKTFVCLGWTLSESGAGGVNLTLREDDSSSYADLAVSGYSTVTPAGGIEQGFFGVPDPSGLSATSHVESIELDWTNPANMTGIIAIEIFASPNSSWSSAVKIGETIGTQFIHDESNGVDAIGENDQRYYWVRARRFPAGEGSDAVSDRNPDSDTSTVQATKGALGNLADLDTVGDSQIDDNAVTNRTIADDAVDTDQINNGAVDTDQIANDAVDITKIADTLESTNYVQGSAGWKLTTDGTFEAGDGTFRGALTATSGSIATTVTIGGTAASTVTSGAASGATALQNGDDITDGTVGGITITSSSLYQGTGTWANSNTGFYLDNTGKFSLKDKLFFNPSNTKLTVAGNIEADTITVNDSLVVLGPLEAKSLAPGSITREMFSQDALDEIFGSLATSVGGSNGDYKENTGNFTASGGTVTLGTSSDKFDHGTSDVDVEFLVDHFFYTTTNYTTAQAQATLNFEVSADGTFTDLTSATKTHTLQFNEYDLSSYYGYTYLVYYLTGDVTKTFTSGSGNDIADNTDVQFRVRVTGVGTAFTGQTVPFTVEANEGVTGVVSTGGNADTLDNLDSTAFLRSNTNDTFDGDLTITGQLILNGSIDQYNVTDLDVSDKTITVNSGNTQSLSDGAGLIVDRGTAADASILWNETSDAFDISHSITIQEPSPYIVLKDTTDNDDQKIIFKNNTDGVDYEIATQNSTSNDAFTFYSASQEIVSRIGSNNIFEVHSNVVKSLKPLEVSGTVTWTGGSSTNANTAYGWGDHASGGYSDEYKNYGVASGANNDTHHWNKTHAAYSNNGSSPTYIVLTTNVPQDNYSMGGFTLVFQNQYNNSGNDEGDTVTIYGYWNPESNTGFVGFRYHTSNPDCAPTIQVGRNTSGKTVFLISNELGNYAQVVAKDLWLGYNAASANSTWGDSWAFSEASTTGNISNLDTLNRVGITAAQRTNWNAAYGWGDHSLAGYLTSYTEADTLDSVTGRGATTTNAISTGAITSSGDISGSSFKVGAVSVIGSNQRITTADGTASKAAYGFTSDSTTGISKTAAGRVAFLSSGVVKAYIQSGSSNPISPTMYVDGRTEINDVVTWTGGSSTNANTAYTYSQVGHLPLSGGTTTGGVTVGGGLTTGPITVTPQDAAGGLEGGEIVLQGATGDESINLDNYDSIFRIFDSSTPQVRLRLDTDGNAEFAGTVQTTNGSAAAPSHTFTADTDTGLYKENYTTDKRQVSISTDGVRRFYANEAGIFTSNNVYLSTFGSLRSFGSFTNITNGLAGGGFKFRNTADSVDSLNVTSGGDGTFAGVVRGSGFSTDGLAKSYTWRAIDNTSSSSGWVWIARVTGAQSSRFSIELAGRSTSYGDGVIPAMGHIVGQLNNDNNYDIIFYNAKSGSSEVVTEVGQVDVDTVSTDIYIQVGNFSEVTATAHISDGSIATKSTLYTSQPSGYVAATEVTVWNSGNDSALTLDYVTDNGATTTNSISIGHVGVDGVASATYPLYVHGHIAQASGSIYSFGDIVIGQGGLKKGSTTYISSSGVLANVTANADIITSGVLNYSRIPSPASTGWWNNGFVRVQTDGVMEVGKYLDFHTANTGGGSDFDVRITASPSAISVGGTVAWTGGSSTNANTAYTYSQVGHLPLAGGTLTGNIVTSGNVQAGSGSGGGFSVGTDTIIGSNKRLTAADGTTVKAAYGFQSSSATGISYTASNNRVNILSNGVVKAYIQTGSSNPLVETMDVDGYITWDGGSSTNANTAYGWGDHSTAGYLTAEADTLATVTGRGATTTNAISTGAITSSATVKGNKFNINSTEILDSNRVLKNITRAEFVNFAVTGTSATDNSLIRSVNIGHLTEGSHASHPYFFNDLANFTERGGVISYGGLNNAPSLTHAFKASSNHAYFTTSNYTGSTMTITLTSLPHGLNYSGYIGISFGNISWAPASCTIEVSTNGGSTWTTRLTNGSKQEMYFTSTGAGASAVNAIRFTLGQPTSSMRITNIWAYNYASDGMEQYFLSKAGGTVYGAISSGAITSTGSSSFGDIAVGGAADSNYDLKVYGLARFEGVANFINNVQVGGFTVITSARNMQNIGNINIGGYYAMDGVTIIDTSKNLINIGTINSGAITTSGNLTMTGNQLKVISSTDSNLGWMIRDNTYVTDEMDITATRLGSGNQPTLGLAGQSGINFYVGGSNVGSFNASGNLTGIGTISSGSITSSGNVVSTGTHNGSQFRASYGSSTNPAYTFKNDDDTGMYGVGGSIKFAVNGSDRYIIGATAHTMSGNLSLSGTLSTGAITSTGVSSFGGGTTVGSVELDGSSIGIQEAGLLFQPNSAFRCIHPTSMTATAHTSDISLGWSNNKWKDIYLAGYVKADSGYQIGTQTVIDSARNITAGTISSGVITSSGRQFQAAETRIHQTAHLAAPSNTTQRNRRTFLQVSYNSHHWMNVGVFKITVKPKYPSGVETAEYLLHVGYLDTSGAGSQGGSGGAVNDFVLRRISSSKVQNGYNHEIIVGTPVDTGVDSGGYDVYSVPIIIENGYYANHTVTVEAPVNTFSQVSSFSGQNQYIFTENPSATTLSGQVVNKLPVNQALYGVLYGNTQYFKSTTLTDGTSYYVDPSNTGTSINVAGGITSGNITSSGNVVSTGTHNGSQFRASLGTQSAPAYTFKNDDDSGFYSGGNTVYGVTGGQKRLTLNASGVSAHNDLIVLTGKLKFGTLDVIDASRNLKNIQSFDTVLVPRTFSIPNTGSATNQWIYIGRATSMPQTGNSVTIRLRFNSGYNASGAQNAEGYIRFKTANASSNDGGFYGDVQLYRFGQNAAALQQVKVVQSGTSEYRFYILTNSFTGASDYTVEQSSGAWVNVGTYSGSAPTGTLVTADPRRIFTSGFAQNDNLNLGTGTLTSGAITSSDNVSFGNSGNISMDSSANGQVEIKGSGYQGAIALDGAAMCIYHSSSARSLILGTNQTSRMSISGAGAFNFHANGLSNIGSVSTTGPLVLQVSSVDTAHQRVDTRDETGDLSRAYWYGVTATGGTSNFRHAWYDGSNYINVTAASSAVTFGGSLVASGNVTAYSDERLKSDIRTLDGAKVYDMRGVSFTKDDEAGSGVIAQELEAIAPELVHTADDEAGTKSVAYGNLVGYLIEAVKGQKAIIDELTQRIEELENGNH